MPSDKSYFPIYSQSRICDSYGVPVCYLTPMCLYGANESHPHVCEPYVVGNNVFGGWLTSYMPGTLDAFRPPWDMNSLKAAVQVAEVGTGEVANAIRYCTFNPREQAFTKLITLCGRWSEPNKAVEVFEAMTNCQGVKPNTITYTSLISACNTSADWKKALEVFSDMKKAAIRDRRCQPNTVTYGKVICACENGRYHDFAVSCYREMKAKNLETDRGISCSVLNSCIQLNYWKEAEEIILSMHEKGIPANLSHYSSMINYYAKHMQWETALNFFVTMQQLNQSVDGECCHALMIAFELAHKTDMAKELVNAIWAEGIEIEAKTYISALRAFASVNDWENAFLIVKRMVTVFATIPKQTKELILVTVKTSAQKNVITKFEDLLNNSDEEQSANCRTRFTK